MSNKLEIRRDAMMVKGYRKYLQSLSHGALVDFILSGGQLAFTPNKELDIALAELDDERSRHARATQKINELVHENRQLHEQLRELQPVNTAGDFEQNADNDSVESMDDFMRGFLNFLDGIVSEAEGPVYTNSAEYAKDHPECQFFSVVISNDEMRDELIVPEVSDTIAELLVKYDSYSFVSAHVDGARLETFFPSLTPALGFVREIQAKGITEKTYAAYVIRASI